MDENFQPSTPTEMMLVNEIRKLKIQIYEMNKISPYDLKLYEHHDEPILSKDFPEVLKLYRTARVICSATPYGGIQVRLDVLYGNNERFGSQYMHSEPEKLNKHQAADLAMQLHKQQLHSIGNFLSKNQ